MDAVKIVKLTNKVAFYSVGLLAYWVFIFVAITVFDFKVFKENITEAFYLSILGLFALLGGAIILNIMLNLTRIAECLERESGYPDAKGRLNKKWAIVAAASFPVIFGLLFLGDMSSSIRKKGLLIETATYLMSEHRDSINVLANYSFSPAYVDKASDILKVLSRIEEKFPHVSLIVRDTIDSKPVLLEFTPWNRKPNETDFKKEDFIFAASKPEREHLGSVFDGKESSVHFSAHDGRYELYFPIKTEHGVIVLYLSDRQAYGKLGS